MNKFNKWLVFSCLIVLVGCMAAPNNSSCFSAQTGDLTEAQKKITQIARAQNAMGWHYYNGDGVPKSFEESFKWFYKSANLCEASAQFNVGMMYQKGEGVKQDFNEAIKWYLKSAEQGNSSAQLNLGMMYISARGVDRNINEGIKWLSKAADQGDATAKKNLEWLFEQGYVKEFSRK